MVDSFDRKASIYMYGVSPIKLTIVTKVHVLMQDLLKQCRTKIANQEEKRSKFYDNLLGMKFNVEDRKAIALDAQNAISQSEY